jgi:hypothetical protein
MDVCFNLSSLTILPLLLIPELQIKLQYLFSLKILIDKLSYRYGNFYNYFYDLALVSFIFFFTVLSGANISKKCAYRQQFFKYSMFVTIT